MFVGVCGMVYVWIFFGCVWGVFGLSWAVGRRGFCLDLFSGGRGIVGIVSGFG